MDYVDIKCMSQKSFVFTENCLAIVLSERGRLQLHGAIYRPDSFVLMLRYCAKGMLRLKISSIDLSRVA